MFCALPPYPLSFHDVTLLRVRVLLLRAHGLRNGTRAGPLQRCVAMPIGDNIVGMWKGWRNAGILKQGFCAGRTTWAEVCMRHILFWS